MPSFFTVVPRGVEDLLMDELRELGVSTLKGTPGGVGFQADWETAYRVLLNTRLASKLLHPLRSFTAADDGELYEAVTAFPWEQHFEVHHSFAVDVALRNAPVQHSQYVAQRVKDGVVDRFRARLNRRPNVDRMEPDIRVHLLWQRNQVTLSLDLAGYSLHQRGYRQQTGEAPLKEHLAAAMLYRAGWPALASQGASLVDPFCGSGTLLIEGLLMAANMAPGLFNPNLGASAWAHFQPNLWRRIQSEAREKGKAGLAKLKGDYLGSDLDGDVLIAARNNARVARILKFLHFEKRAIHEWQPGMTTSMPPGLVIANPPFGERMGDLPESIGVFAAFGKTLRTCFLNWQAAILTGDRILGKHLALRAHKVNSFKNGPLDCSLLRLHIVPERFAGAESSKSPGGTPTSLNPGEQMLANRLRKNQKQLAKWLKREGVSCYRLYDADMPEYNVAVDIYDKYVLIQEYQAPKTIDPRQVEKRLHDILRVVPEVLAIPREQMILKQRKRQRGNEQYGKLNQQDQSLFVDENGLKFEVNLTDYLDTGLFLDHRMVRQRIADLSNDQSFLNLFAYTGTATVYAARGGASETVTVDMSENYLAWAERNLNRNGFRGRQHEFIQADCLTWIRHQPRRFDLIFLDPPTFSNSKRMQATLDVQRDHVALIREVVRLLKPDGKLIFSNNARRFKLDEAGLHEDGLVITDLTRATMPPDFTRNAAIHHCWQLTRD